MRLREQMPELDGASLWYNSHPITRNDLIGIRPTLIHFWSVSCKSCKDAMPKVNSLRDKYREQLNLIAVHMPRTENDLDPGLVKKAAEDYHIKQPIFVDNKHVLTDTFRNKHVPSFYLFDETGKLRHYQSGDGGMRMLQRRVDRLLEINQ